MNFIKLNLAHLTAIIALLILTLAYNFSIIEGKRLRQEDMTQVRGMNRELLNFHKQTNTYALWTNTLFSGMPAYQIYAPKPNQYIQYLHGTLAKIGIATPASEIFLMLLCFYILFVILGLQPWLAAAAAIATTFSSYNFIILDVGHITKAYAIGYIGLVLGGFIWLYKGQLWKGFALLSVGFALQLYANHLQITYYMAMMLLLFVIFKFIKAIKEQKITQFIKASAMALTAMSIALMANFSNLATTYAFSKETMRGKSELKAAEGKNQNGLDKDYAFSWSYGVAETATLIIPNFFGGASATDIGQKSQTYKTLTAGGVPNDQARSFVANAPTYFGDQPSTAGPSYFGVITILLFVMGLWLVKGQFKWWLVATTLLSLLIMWGKNAEWFGGLMFDYFPLYNKFRAVSMAQALASISMPVLGFLTIQKIINHEFSKQEAQKALYYALGIVGGFCLIFALVPSIVDASNPAVDGSEQLKSFPGLVDALVADRLQLLQNDAWRSLLFIGIAGALIWASINQKIKNANHIAIALTLLVVVDLWAIDKRYLNADDFTSKQNINTPFEELEVDRQIKQDQMLSYRVLDLSTDPFNSNRCSYFHQSIGGYNPAKLARYEDLKNQYLVKMHLPTLNMLNAKYIIQPNQQTGELAVAQNPEAMGNAWFVSQIKTMDNAKTELDALENLNIKTQCTIDKRYVKFVEGKTFKSDSTATIALVARNRPDELIYNTQNQTEQLAIFSEIFYEDGWNAYIDGKKTNYFRANYALRAMVVPAGKHEIRFVFEPQTYIVAEKIALVGSILLLLSFAVSCFLGYKESQRIVV